MEMNRNNTTIYVVMLFVAIFAVATSFVMADPNAPLSTTPIGTSSRNLSGLPTQSVNAIGGNVTEININTISVTKSWQGYYGNVSGIVTLQDGNNNTFYNWSQAHPKGQIYATRVTSVAWSSIACASALNASAEDTYLSLNQSDADSVDNTFNKGTHPTFKVGTVTLGTNACPYSTYGYVNNNSQSASYSMVLLHTGANIVYTTITNSSTTGFDGKQHDFQLLVGENEKTTSGVTTYYFWTEFS